MFTGAYSGPSTDQTSQGRGVAILLSYYTLVGVYSKKSQQCYSDNGSRSAAQIVSNNFDIFTEL